MEQNKITPAPWKVEIEGGKFPAYSITTDVEEGANNTVCNLFTATMGEKAHQEFNAFAIVSAVNNTYGASINPEAVPNLKKCLEELLYQFEKVVSPKFTLDHMLIREAHAAIEKAKL